MKVLYYGLIQEEVGLKEEELECSSTDQLLEIVVKRNPSLGSVKKSIFVNQELIKENTELGPSDEVVLCPPFAGG